MTLSIFEQLKMPFEVKKIHWRIGARTKDLSKGIALAYVDARDVMYRLDDVVGPELWQNRYTHVTPNGVVCEIGIYTDLGWIWKANGAGETDVEGEKGGMSDAFKRAAVMHGIGRYLYALPNVWVPLENNGRKLAQVPPLPEWATPEGYLKILEKRNAGR